MPGPGGAGHRGRRGRRTGAMIRVAQERISELFSLAEQEARRGHGPTPDRCVQLARRLGMRYNVRFLPEYRELYCRGCGAYWVEGTTMRARLRGGHRTQTCLRCGRVRRVLLRSRPALESSLLPRPRDPVDEQAPALAEDEAGDPASPLDEGEEE